MATWITKTNIRDPSAYSPVSGESHKVGEDVANYVFLWEVPSNGSTSVLWGGTTLTEVNVTPATLTQYRVVYSGRWAGAIEFNSGLSGQTVNVSYTGKGTNIFARDFNRIQTEKIDRDGSIPFTGLAKTPLGLTTATGLTPLNAGEIIMPGGHTIALERSGSKTDWQFWHGQSTNGQPNMKLAMGTAALINAPSGDANALQLHQYATGTQNLPFMIMVRWAGGIQDFISCADRTTGTYVYPWAVKADGRVLAQVVNTTSSGIYFSHDQNLTVSPTAASSAQYAGMSSTTYVISPAAGVINGVVSALNGDAKLDITSSAGITGQLVGVFGASRNNSNTQTIAQARGVYGFVVNNSAGAITNGRAVYGLLQNLGSGTITDGHAGYFTIQNTAAGVITNGYGVRIVAATNSGSGSITTNYGLYVESPTAGVTNYAIYVAGGQTYLAGTLKVGGNVGFNGTTPVAKGTITGSRSSGAALVSLLAYLVSRGDIVDSTTT